MSNCEKEYMGNCRICADEHKFPHRFCCLYECNEHQFCDGCKKGINQSDKQN